MPSAEDKDLLQRLQSVQAFRGLDRLPGRASLATELQRHRGGAACLSEKFRRKRPPGFTHLIVGNPSLADLKVAWGVFLDGSTFDSASALRKNSSSLRSRRLLLQPRLAWLLPRVKTARPAP